MQLYLWWIVAGIILIMIEFCTPTMFFLNLGFACLFTSIFAYLGYSSIIQAFAFLLSACMFFIFVKPFLKAFYDKKSKLADKYIGQTVKVVQETNKSDGRVAIYGEEWQAKTINENDVFEVGSEVVIVKMDSLIMYVDKKQY